MDTKTVAEDIVRTLGAGFSTKNVGAVQGILDAAIAAEEAQPATTDPQVAAAAAASSEVSGGGSEAEAGGAE